MLLNHSPAGMVGAPALAAPPADTSLCAQEPIHIPGAIQPHGAFLAAGPDGRITHASANLAGLLGVAAAAALGQDLAAVIGAGAAAALARAPAPAAPAECFHHLHRPGGAALQARGFRAGPYLGIDIETPGPPDQTMSACLAAQALLARLEGAGSQLELCAWAVTGLKALTGYARVMAYRFDPEGHGEVIAEAREPALPPYLGLHYPAADIPAQARTLFLRQRVGAVADAGYTPVPLQTSLPGGGAAPLDLTFSTLRSVSPVHLAYMRNMGTVASLTVALVTEGRLWGMLVCHHGSRRVAGPALRAAAAITGQLVSRMLVSLAGAETAARQAEGQAAVVAVAARMAQGLQLAEALASPALLRVTSAAGAAIRAGGHLRLTGATPAPEAAWHAMAVLQAEAAGAPCATSCLALRHPALAACAQHGSGALLLPLTPGTDDAILFFRPERRRHVTWAGDPTAHLARDPVTGALSPRASFAAWEEMVTGHAAPWEEGDLAMAHQLAQLVAGEQARLAQSELADLRRDLAAGARAAAPHRSYAKLLAVLPDAMIAIDQHGVIQLANPMAARQFGYKLEQLAGRPVASLLPDYPLDPPPPAPPGQVFELSGTRRDGTFFPAEITASVLPGSRLRLTLAAIRDISVRKNAERHLAKMETRYRSLLEASPDVMVMIDEQENIVLMNRQAAIQFGYAQNQLTGQSVRTIIREGLHDPPDHTAPTAAPGAASESAAPGAVSAPSESSSPNAPRVLERTARRRDGREFPVEIIVGPLAGEPGPPAREPARAGGETRVRAAAIRDISARKQAEAILLQKVEELNRSNMELEQFASIASHDLQEPLRIVAGYTQLLGRRYHGRLDADADKFIAFAVDGATRMQQLIQDMLAYSRLGAKILAPAPTEAGDSLEAALSRLHGVIEETHALITYDQLPAVLADPRQLAQLFQNLVSNAIKYHGPDPPCVHISAAPAPGGKWRFSVRDHGIGIDPQHFQRIFGMFQRLHSRQDFSGTGIGLAICKKIVESHGGAIWVESAPGAGADFRFTLPAAVDAAAVDAAPVDAAPVDAAAADAA